MADTELSEDQWVETFRPLDGPDGSMLWDHAPTLDYPINQVWTVVSSDDWTRELVVPGYRTVNRTGYAVTEVPWTDAGVVAVWDDGHRD